MLRCYRWKYLVSDYHRFHCLKLNKWHLQKWKTPSGPRRTPSVIYSCLIGQMTKGNMKIKSFSNDNVKYLIQNKSLVTSRGFLFGPTRRWQRYHNESNADNVHPPIHRIPEFEKINNAHTVCKWNECGFHFSFPFNEYGAQFGMAIWFAFIEIVTLTPCTNFSKFFFFPRRLENSDWDFQWWSMRKNILSSNKCQYN